MIKKIVAGLIILITLVQAFSPLCKAVEIDNAEITYTGRTAGEHLLFKKEDGSISSVICSIVGYNVGDKFYPAYCMDPSLPGAESGEYGVNISDYTDNVKVWRVVTNGFPYNNMGLSDDDAYLVTKMAVYCVTGKSNIEMFTYDESNPITKQTYDALRNLVENVAEDVNIQKQTGTITISKVGDFTENGNYFSQTYSVASKLEQRSFEVKDLTGFPEGTIVTNMNNVNQTNFNSGEQFKISIPKEKLTENISGNFNIVGKVKNYPVFFGKAPDGRQNYTVTFDSFGDELAMRKF